MPQFKTHNLWPIPVYEAEIPVKREWKDFIINLEYERTHIGNSDISKNRNIFNKMNDLKNKINFHCENYLRKYLFVSNNAQFYFLNSWVNIHHPKDESQIHYHRNSLISGVYYPIFPKNSGDLVFHKSTIYNNLFHHCITPEFDEHSNVTAQKYMLEVTEGTIVIFPSHLEHSVEKNESNEIRYSIAFNLFVKGKFGREEYELEIR